MISENFAHGVSRVDVVGGMVRLELFTLAPPEGEGKTPSAIPTQAIILPMEGFLRAFGIQENLVQQMIKAGIIGRREGEATESQPISPNFP